MWRSMGKRKTRDEESGRKVGGEAGLGEESLRKRRREETEDRKGEAWAEKRRGQSRGCGAWRIWNGHEARKGNEGWSGGGNGVRGNGGRWSERKEAGRGERMRFGNVWGKERKKERILRLWRGKKRISL